VSVINRRCHRYLIGLEGAEAQAERERSLGWQTGSINPDVSPADYVWNLSGDDVLCHAIDTITPKYAETLGLCLIDQGAGCVGIFDRRANCLFGQYPTMKTLPEDTTMTARIRLNEPVFRACFSQDSPKIETVTPFAWIRDDLYAVHCLSTESSRFTTMTLEDLSSYGDNQQAKKAIDVAELCDDINGADTNKLAEGLLACPEELTKIRCVLKSAQRSKNTQECAEDMCF
jgi:hypothetical protein